MTAVSEHGSNLRTSISVCNSLIGVIQILLSSPKVDVNCMNIFTKFYKISKKNFFLMTLMNLIYL